MPTANKKWAVAVDKKRTKTSQTSALSQFGLAEVGLLAILASLSLLLYYQAMHLWERPHFQFFPIAWLAFVLLMYQRIEALETTGDRWRRRGAWTLWLFGLLAALLAARGFSPWLAHGAVILCVTAWGLLRLAPLSAWTWLGWTLLLWVTMPLPTQLDSRLIGTLQQLSSQSASSLLDLFGVVHLPQGNLIEIKSGQLFVDEACSGIDSLYSLTAIALLFLVWQRRPLVIGVLTLLCVPAFAWLGNVLRLLVIAVALDRLSIDLSHGVRHTALGLLTFAVSGWCLYHTSASFALVFKRFSTSAMPRERRQWHVFYNYLVCFPGNAPQVKADDDNYFDKDAPKVDAPIVAKALRRRTPDARQAAKASSTRPLIAWPVLGLAGSLAVVGLTGMRYLRPEEIHAEMTLPHFEMADVEASIGPNDFPENLLDAERLTFQQEHRPRDSFLGEYSRAWAYRHPVADFLVSIDFPFRGFHPLWLCYEGAGQKVAETPQLIDLTASGPVTSQEGRVTYMKLQDPLGAPSYVWFALFEADGQLIRPGLYQADTRRLLTERIRSMVFEPAASVDPITYQHQLYVQCGRELTESERQLFAKIFAVGLAHAVAKVQELNQQ